MHDPNSLSLDHLFESLAGDGNVHALITLALREDLSEAGDVTTDSVIPADEVGAAAFVAREAGVVSGLAALPKLIDRIATRYQHFELLDLVTESRDGQLCAPGNVLATLNGNMRTILAVERTALNLLSRMSGIATLTARFVEAVHGTNAVICDTRKTMPGMRALDKYAVRCGGGTLHRIGLFDAALYKDNHLAGVPIEDLRQVMTEAATRARAEHDLQFVEVEVDSIAQFKQILLVESGLIDYVLLDNFKLDALKTAVTLRDQHQSRLKLEASGGVNLTTVRAIAETGVDRISVGALTHSAPHLDIALDIA